jgi:adenylate cyclase
MTTSRSGVAPDDDEQERLAKAVITLAACLVAALSSVWVVIYFTLGLPVSAAIPLAYQVVSIGSLIAFAKTKRLRFLRTSQLAMMLMLPFLLQLSLGGFVPSSAVVLWSFTAPVAALMLNGTRSSIGWFLAYVAVLALSGLLDPFLDPAEVPAALIITLFVLNLAGVSTTAFLLLRYFVRRCGCPVRHQKISTTTSTGSVKEGLTGLARVSPGPLAPRLLRAVHQWLASTSS